MALLTPHSEELLIPPFSCAVRTNVYLGVLLVYLYLVYSSTKTIPTSKAVQASQSKFQTLGAMYW